MQLSNLVSLLSVAIALAGTPQPASAAPSHFDPAGGVKELWRKSGTDAVHHKRIGDLTTKERKNRHRRRGTCVNRPPPDDAAVLTSTSSSAPAPQPTESQAQPEPQPQPQPEPEPEQPVEQPAPEPQPQPEPEPQPQPETPSAPDALAQEFLNAHNSARANHGASPLTWSTQLADAAAKWASGCVFKHSGGTLGQFGENLAAGSGSMSATEAVDAWMSEVGDYNPSNPGASHFTQVVWKKSTQLGCAIVSCPGGTIFPSSFGNSDNIVCEYFPAGNVIGRFAENVQK